MYTYIIKLYEYYQTVVLNWYDSLSLVYEMESVYYGVRLEYLTAVHTVLSLKG